VAVVRLRGHEEVEQLDLVGAGEQSGALVVRAQLVRRLVQRALVVAQLVFELRVAARLAVVVVQPP